MTAPNPRSIVGTRWLTVFDSSGVSVHVSQSVPPSVPDSTRSTLTRDHALADSRIGSSRSTIERAVSAKSTGSSTNCT